MPRIFISHVREDREFVKQLIHDLRQAGADTCSSADFRSARPLGRQIEAALEGSTHFVAVLSPDSVGSRIAKDEWRIAVRQRKPIIAVLIAHESLPAFWDDHSVIPEFVDNYEEGLELLRKWVEGPRPGRSVDEKVAGSIIDIDEETEIDAEEAVVDLERELSTLETTPERGSWHPAAQRPFSSSSPRDPVDCTVFAPPQAPPKDSILIQVFAHLPGRTKEAQEAATEFDDDAQRRGVTSLGTEVAHGSVLGFELQMPHVEIDEAVQELTWRGATTAVGFGVEIPAGLASRTLIGRVLVSQDSVPIGQVRFKLEILESDQIGDPVNVPAGEANRYKTVFVSYASQDRQEVMRRVQMLSAVGIDTFQDVMDLEPGQLWERELYHRIDESDVMFLFWSTPAKESEWVEKEWRYGLENKGEEFIRPVIIEGPPVPPPPPELAHLHFSDRIIYFMQSGQG